MHRHICVSVNYGSRQRNYISRTKRRCEQKKSSTHQPATERWFNTMAMSTREKKWIVWTVHNKMRDAKIFTFVNHACDWTANSEQTIVRARQRMSYVLIALMRTPINSGRIWIWPVCRKPYLFQSYSLYFCSLFSLSLPMCVRAFGVFVVASFFFFRVLFIHFHGKQSVNQYTIPNSIRVCALPVNL